MVVPTNNIIAFSALALGASLSALGVFKYYNAAGGEDGVDRNGGDGADGDTFYNKALLNGEEPNVTYYDVDNNSGVYFHTANSIDVPSQCIYYAVNYNDNVLFLKFLKGFSPHKIRLYSHQSKLHYILKNSNSETHLKQLYEYYQEWKQNKSNDDVRPPRGEHGEDKWKQFFAVVKAGTELNTYTMNEFDYHLVHDDDDLTVHHRATYEGEMCDDPSGEAYGIKLRHGTGRFALVDDLHVFDDKEYDFAVYHDDAQFGDISPVLPLLSYDGKWENDFPTGPGMAVFRYSKNHQPFRNYKMHFYGEMKAHSDTNVNCGVRLGGGVLLMDSKIYISPPVVSPLSPQRYYPVKASNSYILNVLNAAADENLDRFRDMMKSLYDGYLGALKKAPSSKSPDEVMEYVVKELLL